MEIPQILVEGPPGAGKTTFLQHLFLSNRSRRIAATRIGGAAGDLARLRDAGAADTALIRRLPNNLEMALSGDFDGVVHEAEPGVDLPADHLVFVTRPVEGLVEECPLDPIEYAESLYDHPERQPVQRIYGVARVLERLDYWHWFRRGSEAIGPAKSVVINVESGEERKMAWRMAFDIRVAEARQRSLIEAECVIRGWPRRRNLYIADLLNRRDPDLKKALATLKRKMPRRAKDRHRQVWTGS